MWNRLSRTFFLVFTTVGIMGCPPNQQGKGSSVVQPNEQQTNQPFRWTIIINGKKQALLKDSANLEIGLKEWSCGYQIDAVDRVGPATEQFGVLDCRHTNTGVVADSLVLCRTDKDTPNDYGSSNLQIIEPGGKAGFMELACVSSNRKIIRPALGETGLHSITSAASRPGGAAVERAIKPSVFAWRLEVGNREKVSRVETLHADRGMVTPDLPGWECEYKLYGLDDQYYGYAELGEVSCRAQGTRIARWLPCVNYTNRNDTCGMGVLRLSNDKDAMSSLTLLCKNQENPKCWRDTP